MFNAYLAYKVEALHAVMKLRHGEDFGGADLVQSTLCQPGLIDGPDGIGVVADAVTDPPCPRATVTEIQRDGIVGLPRSDPGRADGAALPDRDFDMIAIGNIDPLREPWADSDDVAPGQRGQRFR